MARTKTHRMRGSREHGRGRKKGRGAGLRGGRGNAGSFNHRFLEFLFKDPRYHGRYGFKRPQGLSIEARVVNVGDLEGLVASLEEQGLAVEHEGVYTIDLSGAGVDRLLGSGPVAKALRVKVASASPRAKEKLEAVGGALLPAEG